MASSSGRDPALFAELDSAPDTVTRKLLEANIISEYKTRGLADDEVIQFRFTAMRFAEYLISSALLDRIEQRSMQRGGNPAKCCHYCHFGQSADRRKKMNIVGGALQRTLFLLLDKNPVRIRGDSAPTGGH